MTKNGISFYFNKKLKMLKIVVFISMKLNDIKLFDGSIGLFLNLNSIKNY